MRRFDYSFLQDIMVPASLMTRVSMVEGLKARTSFSRRGHEPVLGDMYRLSLMISVQAARRDGRLYADDRRIVDLFYDRAEPADFDEKLLLGYRDALALVHEHHDDLRIDPVSVKRIYSVLVARTGEPVEYRTADSVIMLPFENGEPRYIMSPVRPEDLTGSMDGMLDACSRASTDLGINKYLLLAVFMLDFLCIQPFRKHNGMMARLCVILLMYRMGMDIQRYVSCDQVVYMYIQSHYEAFTKGSEGWNDYTNDYIPYMQEMARDLFICYGFFERRLRGMNGTNEKSLRVYYQAITTPLPLSKKDICGFLPDVSEAMVELTLSNLVKDGRLTRIGGKRNARYIRTANHWY